MSISNGVLANAANFNAAFDSKTKEFNSQSTTYQILAADTQKIIGCDPSSASFTVTLPSLADVRGEKIIITRTNSASALDKIVTISRSGSDTIGNALTSVKLATFQETITLYAPNTGTNWVILNRSIPDNVTTFVPTGSWSTNSTYTGAYWRIGRFLHMDVRVSQSGTATAANLTFNLPSGLTIDTTYLVSADATMPFGRAIALDNGVASYDCTVVYSSTTAVAIRVNNASGTYATFSNVSNTVPITFDNGDQVTAYVIGVPIVNWEG